MSGLDAGMCQVGRGKRWAVLCAGIAAADGNRGGVVAQSVVVERQLQVDGSCHYLSADSALTSFKVQTSQLPPKGKQESNDTAVSKWNCISVAAHH